jgi:hypothetical protein
MHAGRAGATNGDETDYLGRGGRVPYAHVRPGTRRRVRQGANRRQRRTTRAALRTGREV